MKAAGFGSDIKNKRDTSEFNVFILIHLEQKLLLLNAGPKTELSFPMVPDGWVQSLVLGRVVALGLVSLASSFYCS